MTLVLNNRISTAKISFPLWFTHLTSTPRLNNVSSGPVYKLGILDEQIIMDVITHRVIKTVYYVDIPAAFVMN